MRFIHLSDLHLGKRLNGYSMLEDQDYILTRIINIIDEEKPDGIIVAGDVYDRSIPSEEAMQLWDKFLGRLAKRSIPVYAISGNHDSAVRFADHSALIKSMDIHFSPEYRGEVEVIKLDDEHGPVSIYLLPFVKPVHVKSAFPDEEITNYTDACRVAIEHMNVDENERNILVAHQFVVGAKTCDSEEKSVGGIDQVSADVFDSFDYVALGHIHGPQHISRDTIRYCGTPLKYSLSEKNHTKSVTVVDLGAKGDVEISEIPLAPLHELKEIRGSFEELTSKEYTDSIDKDDYVYIVLTDEEDIPEGFGKLNRIYKNLMNLSYDNTRTRSKAELTDLADVENKSPLELFAQFYTEQNGQPMSDEQEAFMKNLISSIWEV